MENIRIKIGLFFTLIATTSTAQEALDKSKQYEACVISFYNVENVFDTLVDPDTTLILQDDFTPFGEKNWNTEKYYKKMANLDEVLSQIGTDISPDGPVLLGLGEIENRLVLEDIVKLPKISSRNYQIVHKDGPDHRGIDVGLLYNPKYFEFESFKSIRLTLKDDSSWTSRDQLLVSGKLLGEPIYVVVAHWPSKSGGAKKSEPKRNAAGDLAREIVDSLFVINPKAKIIYMGDLNDDPLSDCVKKHFNTVAKVEKIEGNVMFNAMETLHKQGIGSYCYQGVWGVIDHLILSPEFAKGDYSSFRYYTAKVFNKEFLKNQTGSYKGQPFRTFGGSDFLNGYSDHFPVYTVVIREKR